MGDPINDASNANKILAYESLERKISAIPNWPFEIPQMNKIIIITLSVTASIIAKYVMLFLKI